MKKSFRPKISIPLWTILFFLTLGAIWHLPLWWVYSNRTENRILRLEIPSVARDVRMVFQPSVPGTSNNLPSWLDPTLYLLPDDRGFSKGLRPAEFPKEEEWFLAATRPPDLSEPLRIEKNAAFNGNNPIPAWVFASSMEKASNAGRSPTSHENAASGESAWHVTGPIKERLIQPYPTFPHIHSSELLSPTLLRMGITSSGDPQFVILETGSGSDEADQLGIFFARNLRFAPREEPANDPVTWGYLKILWQAGEK